MRLKHAIAAISSGSVEMNVFMGEASSVIRESDVYAAAVSSVRPVLLATATNMMNVAKGASTIVELPTVGQR